MIREIPYDQAEHVTEIRYRLAPLDVGFDVRAHGMAVHVDAADDPIRVSYAGKTGARRVIEGPQTEVLRSLRARGFRFLVR